MIELKRPLSCFDIESTGPDPVLDRILTLAIIKEWPLAPARSMPRRAVFTGKYNGGGKVMTQETIDVHGITNEQAAQWPPLDQAEANRILDFIKGCDLLSFNGTRFDAIMLWEELNRAGVEWDTSDVQHIDAFGIFQIHEPRNLPAALRFYCDREHTEAHDAMGDVEATLAVFEAQTERYTDLWDMDVAALARHSQHDQVRLDLAGKIVLNKEGVAVYAFGKAKGVPVKEDPGFGCWMLGKDFGENTKAVIRRLLEL
jgi:DNA polymerase-3 subunit epsilon